MPTGLPGHPMALLPVRQPVRQPASPPVRLNSPMPRSLLLRLLRGAAVVFGVVSLTFLLLRLAPGDPVARLLGPAASAEQIAAARHGLGLDRPLPAQYADWLGRAVRGDFGASITQGRPAAALLAEAWPATALLVL